MMKIMITGAAGFLGQHLTKLYTDLGYDLVLLDYTDIFHNEPYTGTVHGHSVYDVDIRTEHAFLSQLLMGVDCVIHCANKARIDPSWAQFADYYDTNITASHQFFKLCQSLSVDKFVYISSSSVYGNSTNAIQYESDPMLPTNPYAVSKMAAEWALKTQAQLGKTQLYIVRPFTMYGDNMATGSHALVISKFLTALAADEPLMLHDHGRQVRDFIHINDAVDGIRLVVEHGEHNEIYNLGSGKAVTIKQLADVVSDKQIMAPPRIGPVQSTCADISKLTAFGFNPTTSVIQWLTDRVKELKIKHSNKKETQC